MVATHEVFDPATNTWKQLAPLPRARDHTAMVAADGKIHVIGGRTGASTEKTDQHDIYDPASNTWSSGPPLPTPRSGLAATLYKDLILVLGGELPPNTFAQNEAYNPKTKSWQRARADAGGTSRHRRRRERRQRLSRGRLAAAGLRRSSPTS